MSARDLLPWTLLFALALPGCPSEPTASPTPTPDPGPHPTDVAQGASFSVPGLSAGVEILIGDYGVPHVYAENDHDVAAGAGFMLASDRYFVLELGRRFALGTVADLIGRDGLEIDLENRGGGTTLAVDAVCDNLLPREEELLRGYAAGINGWLAAARAGDMPMPSELELMGPLLGLDDPLAALPDWELRDACGMLTYVLLESSFSTRDIGQQRTLQQLEDERWTGLPEEDRRRDGAALDLWARVQPVLPFSAIEPLSGVSSSSAAVPPEPPEPVRVEAGTLERALEPRLSEGVLGHDHVGGFGSNAWVVGGDRVEGGGGLVASDGHLGLSVPALFYTLHLNTKFLGADPDGIDAMGVTTPGMPAIAVGHNGDVGWGQTQLFADSNDYYAEQLLLDGDGAPRARVWQGGEEDLVAIEETYQVADVPLLGSEGGTEVLTRYETAAGRVLFSVEGRGVSGPDEAEAGETAINVRGDWVVPADQNGDGVIDAVTGDYTGYDGGHALEAFYRFNLADDVDEFRGAMPWLNATSLNWVVADKEGGTFFAGYQATPCRDYLTRTGDGNFISGAHPQALIDGTQYESFEIAFEADGSVQEGGTGANCVVPFEDYPQAQDPEAGFLVTANHDPGSITLDNDLYNDAVYLGGPWEEIWRAWRISEMLAADESHDLDSMKEIQDDELSPLGWRYSGLLRDAIELGRTDEGALGALYAADSARLDEVDAWLARWAELDFHAASGVETFYATPTDEEVEAAAATMIFNAAFSRFVNSVFDDEPLPGVFRPTGVAGRLRSLDPMLYGRGPGNSAGLMSWSPDTEESVFFDVLGTEEVETSDQLMLAALTEALDFLESAPDGEGRGGFGTDDMSQWLWGLRHGPRWEPLVTDLIGDDPFLAPLLEDFQIDPERIEVAPDAPAGDPRRTLAYFPRGGDNSGVEDAKPRFNETDFGHNAASAWRMTVHLTPQGTTAWNILPGGQSGITDSDNFADQAELWLGKEMAPMPFEVADVVAGARTRWSLTP